MAITATHTDWLSPELQRAAVAADSILKGKMHEDCIPYRMLMSILNANKAAGGRCEVSVYVDACRCLITDSPGRDCVLIGHLTYMVSEKYDVASGNGEGFGVAMMRLDKNHPIYSCRESISEIGRSGSLTYLDRVWVVLNSVVKDVLRDLHSKLPL